jgi:hypothetical protein
VPIYFQIPLVLEKRIVKQIPKFAVSLPWDVYMDGVSVTIPPKILAILSGKYVHFGLDDEMHDLDEKVHWE